MADPFVQTARDVAAVIRENGVELRWHSRRDPVNVIGNVSTVALTFLVYIVFPKADMGGMIQDLVGSGVTERGTMGLMAAHGLQFEPRVSDHIDRDNEALHVTSLELIRPAETPIIWKIKFGELEG